VLRRASTYLPEDRLEIVRRAYEFACKHHDGQFRRTGDAYITHPVEVTSLVAMLELDQHALAAALLHDVEEDCGVSNEVLEQEFGAEVAHLVDGLTKLDKLPIRFDPTDQTARDGVQAQNLRKMFLGMAEDIRVVLIKLCDRLHNMRTLWAFQPEKQRRIARETLEIYAPLANRLGVWQIKWELEDLSFRYLEPEKYKEVAERLAAKREVRERYIEEASVVLKQHLDAAGIDAEVTGRAKHIYSIYQKAERYSNQSKGFDQIYDLLALRVFVDSVAECYHALGIAHSLWRPMPGQFDDYIANPKDSMYQSLHTTVVGPGGRPVEIQIRTHEMHRVAEYGVAAHWRYKEGESKQLRKDEERIAWLRQLLDWQRDLTGAEDFVETVKTDIFHDQVFVYTPKGAVIDMPAGATPLDFAYRIHTDLGHQTVGAKVNGRMVSLNSQLKTGDVVDPRSRASKAVARLAESERGVRADGALEGEDPPVVPAPGAGRKHRARKGPVRQRDAATGHRRERPAGRHPRAFQQLRKLGRLLRGAGLRGRQHEHDRSPRRRADPGGSARAGVAGHAHEAGTGATRRARDARAGRRQPADDHGPLLQSCPRRPDRGLRDAQPRRNGAPGGLPQHPQ
jgi:GTP pyrophosphokinase